jgi:hypothetical protein
VLPDGGKTPAIDAQCIDGTRKSRCVPSEAEDRRPSAGRRPLVDSREEQPSSDVGRAWRPTRHTGTRGAHGEVPASRAGALHSAARERAIFPRGVGRPPERPGRGLAAAVVAIAGVVDRLDRASIERRASPVSAPAGAAHKLPKIATLRLGRGALSAWSGSHFSRVGSRAIAGRVAGQAVDHPRAGRTRALCRSMPALPCRRPYRKRDCPAKAGVRTVRHAGNRQSEHSRDPGEWHAGPGRARFERVWAL